MTRQDKRVRGSEAGFTLIEALVSIAIFVFGIMAVANLVLIAMQSNQVGRDGTAAAAAAADRMEQLKATTFDALAPGGDLDSDQAGYSETVNLPGLSPIGVRWQISVAAGGPLFIAVRAESRGAFGRRTRAEFTTFRTESP